MRELMSLMLILVSIAFFNERTEKTEMGVENSILQDRVWHLEALIELEDFENDREPNALHSLSQG